MTSETFTSQQYRMKKNLRFNRLESKLERRYVTGFKAGRIKGDKYYCGFIKCKLVHHQQYSTIVPDQIYLDRAGQLLWIQPIFFLPSVLGFDKVSGVCRLVINISHGVCVTVEFQQDGVHSRLRDGSLLYRCKLTSIPALFSYATGLARLTDSRPQLKLFHHTTAINKKAILSSSELWSSPWNIQGNKKLANISYLYLTSLENVSHEADLQQIAMATNSRIGLRVDQNTTETPDVIITVTRKGICDTTHSIGLWVDADLISPQHVHRHTSPARQIYYGVVSPFISRVGVQPESTGTITCAMLIPKSPQLFEYVIVGDATTLEGLRSPYDEEDTTQIWKIARPGDGEDFISYWREHANSSLFQTLSVNPATFVKNELEATDLPDANGDDCDATFA